MDEGVEGVEKVVYGDGVGEVGGLDEMGVGLGELGGGGFVLEDKEVGGEVGGGVLCKEVVGEGDGG